MATLHELFGAGAIGQVTSDYYNNAYANWSTTANSNLYYYGNAGYYQYPSGQVVPSPPAAKPTRVDEFAWLRGRVEEVCWHN